VSVCVSPAHLQLFRLNFKSKNSIVGITVRGRGLFGKGQVNENIITV